MTLKKSETLKSSGQLPSSPPGRDESLRWRDLRPGDTFFVPRGDTGDPEYNDLTYTVVSVSPGPPGRGREESTNVAVRILTSRGGTELWMGGEDELYYPDVLVGRGR